MSLIKSIDKLYEYTNLGQTYGAYLVNIGSTNEVFVRNRDKLGVVTHFIDGAEITEVSGDVEQDFYARLDHLNKWENYEE